MENSRLSKLFELLAASSSVLREQAANQIGEIAGVHSAESGPLLLKIRAFLHHNSWDARCAAARAVYELGSYCSNVKGEESFENEAENKFLSTLELFDLDKVIRSGFVLASSEGKEFEKVDCELDASSQKNRVKEQLGVYPGLESGIEDFVSEEDFKSTSNGAHETFDDGPSFKIAKIEEEESISYLENELTNCKSADGYQKLWWFYRLLCYDLYNSVWTVRHGAALGLKEITKHLCHSSIYLQKLYSSMKHLFFVSSVDRFNDFVGSHAVAPVRESCAQVIGTLFPSLPTSCKETVMKILLDFISTPETKPWQCVHSGLLMLKYTLPFILPLRSFSQKTVDDLLLATCLCVQFQNEEIIVGASQALSPNLSMISSFADCNTIENLLDIVWKLLLNSNYDVLDDWVRGLLHIAAELGAAYTHPYETEHISTLSRFLDHSSIDICLPAFQCLTIAAKTSHLLNWPEQGILHILRMAFVKSLTTSDSKLYLEIETLWLALIKHQPKTLVVLPACPYFGQWLASLMVAENYPLVDATLLGFENKQIFIGGEDVMALSEVERFEVVTQVKLKSIRLLAYLAIELYHLNSTVAHNDLENPVSSLETCLLFHLNSSSLIRKTVICQLLVEWADIMSKQNEQFTFPFGFQTVLVQNLMQNSSIYEELLPKITELNALCQDFSKSLKKFKINVDFNTVINLKDAVEFCQKFVDQIVETSNKSGPRSVEFEDKLNSFKNEVHSKSYDIQQNTNRLLCWFSCAAVRFSILPDKLNPVIIPLMEIVKSERNSCIVEEACHSLAQLLIQTVSRNPSPSWKILKNLVCLHCSDESKTPSYLSSGDGILMFNAEKRLNFESETPSSRKNTISSDVNSKNVTVAAKNAGLVLSKVCATCNDRLCDIVPNFWSILNKFPENESQDLIYSLQVLETVFSSLTVEQQKKIENSSKDKLLQFITSKIYSVRNMTSRFIAVLSEVDILFVINEILPTLLNFLNDSQNESSRCGSMETIFVMVEELKVNLVGVASVIALPVLARMSDTVFCIRQMAARCFGTLVKILPLEAKTEMSGLCDQVKALFNEQRQFLNLLTHPDSLSQSDLPLPSVTKADLRSYQKDGVTWLSFLNKYNLHGILSDDMGLGKTLQTLCCLALSRDSNCDNLPSLIVCPKTLVQHWVGETGKFFSENVLRATSLDTSGFRGDFALLEKFNVLITSYDFVRRETRLFESQRFHYCILDEGHMIKNPKTLTSKAVMQLKSNYRLVLSGTPVQNNVLELWSLFEFLIPGYLGDRKQFQQRFGKPILSSRDAKASSNEMRAGHAALDSLHKMVLPFILRRRKTDVLDELPPKIVQDYYCVLSQLQKKLYQDFSQNALSQLINETSGSQRNAFQILTYLRKLCDHPCLVLTKDHCAYHEVSDSLKQTYGCDTLQDISLSGKIVALRQLLLECGIGHTADEEEDDQAVPSISAHRALIFCQFKSVVDLIADYFQQNVFGSISYLRLDGSVPPTERQAVADKFNQDPSIDALLLTTHIGGLGLNLTGADIVIFVDHDWNPARDLQAMDRAHRIGQKRTVNVYRLITQGTLEEKIMRFQLFKSQNADAIIGEQNRSLASMATEQLLDLLSMDNSQKVSESKHSTNRKSSGKKSLAGVSSSESHQTTDLTSLWDQSQYEEAFDLNKFLQSMKKI